MDNLSLMWWRVKSRRQILPRFPSGICRVAVVDCRRHKKLQAQSHFRLRTRDVTHLLTFWWWLIVKCTMVDMIVPQPSGPIYSELHTQNIMNFSIPIARQSPNLHELPLLCREDAVGAVSVILSALQNQERRIFMRSLSR